MRIFFNIYNKLSKKNTIKNSNRKEFENIMDFANKMAEKNKYALIDIVKLLLVPLQYKLITEPIIKDAHGVDDNNYVSNFFWNDDEIHLWENMRNKDNKIEVKDKNNKFILDLKKNIIISTPWNKKSLLDLLSSVGIGKNKISWKMDDINHRVEIWLPWGISVVRGGNHSIAVGIVSGDGQLEPYVIYNMNNIFEIVKCDGENYIDIKTNKIIAPVTNINIAGVFEIGRLMANNNIHAWPEVTFIKNKN
ncbi:MAG: DUF6710 family protein [bacterium]